MRRFQSVYGPDFRAHSFRAVLGFHPTGLPDELRLLRGLGYYYLEGPGTLGVLGGSERAGG